MDPFEGLHDVLHAQVHRVRVLAAQGGEVDISVDIQPMVDGDGDDIPLVGEGAALVAVQIVTGAGGITAAVDPQEYGTLLAVVDSLRPYIEHQTGFLAHRLHDKLIAEIVVSLGVVPPDEVLALHGLGAI